MTGRSRETRAHEKMKLSSTRPKVDHQLPDDVKVLRFLRTSRAFSPARALRADLIAEAVGVPLDKVLDVLWAAETIDHAVLPLHWHWPLCAQSAFYLQDRAGALRDAAEDADTVANAFRDAAAVLRGFARTAVVKHTSRRS